MPKMTLAYGEEVIERLGQLPMDREPLWGKLTAQELVPHLIGVMQSSMGKVPAQQSTGNWFTRTILPPIVYATGMTPPKHLKTVDESGNDTTAILAEGTLDDLKALIEEFVAGEEGQSLAASPHPLFGEIGTTGWSRIHYVHFKHHLKQFQL